MKAIRIIEAALCADQLLTPSSHPKRGYLLLAVLNLPFLVFSMETASTDSLPPYAFFIAGYLLQPLASGVSKLAGGFQGDAARERGEALGQSIAHLSNALIAFGAGDLALEKFGDISHFPPVESFGYVYTGWAALAAACCGRRIFVGVRGLKTHIGRYVNGYSNISG